LRYRKQSAKAEILTGPLRKKGRDRARPGRQQPAGPVKISGLADWFLYLKPIPRERLTHLPDDGGSKDLWNAGKLLPHYTALQPRRQPYSYSPPWEPQILLLYLYNRFWSLNFISCVVPQVVTFISEQTVQTTRQAVQQKCLHDVPGLAFFNCRITIRNLTEIQTVASDIKHRKADTYPLYIRMLYGTHWKNLFALKKS
jgi:hypothetical protein